MSNIIRPSFGGRPKPETPAAPAEEQTLLRHVGTAGGYLVGLIRDEATPEGDVLKVVVGPADGRQVETVAIVPATAAGEVDADTLAMAILRTLEVVAADDGSGAA